MTVVWLVAWFRLPDLAARLPAPDAAAALADITRTLVGDPVATDKVEPDADVLGRVVAACRQAALGDAPPAVRLDAMECAVNLGDKELPALLLHVGDPDVRAGAAGWAPPEALYDVVLRDDAALAAGAAAAALCAADAVGTLARVGDEGRKRLKVLAADPAVDRGYRRAIGFCTRRR